MIFFSFSIEAIFVCLIGMGEGDVTSLSLTSLKLYFFKTLNDDVAWLCTLELESNMNEDIG